MYVVIGESTQCDGGLMGVRGHSHNYHYHTTTTTTTTGDPIVLLGKQSNSLAMALGLLGVAVATLTTNVAANVVGPANALVNIAPQRISFTMGGVITALLGVVMMPWRLIASSQVL